MNSCKVLSPAQGAQCVEGVVLASHYCLTALPGSKHTALRSLGGPLGEDKGAPCGAGVCVCDQGPCFKGVGGGSSSGHFHNSLHTN